MQRRLIIISERQRNEILRFLGMASKLAPLFFVFSLISLFFAHSPFPLVGAGFLLIGLVAVALLFLSWHHYNYWWSWMIWAVPLLVLGAIFLSAFVLPLVRVGALHPLAVLFGTFGLGGVGFFAPLFFLRRRVRVWYGL